MPKQPKQLRAADTQAITSDDLIEVLRNKVRAGSGTTYAEVSQWAYGSRTRNQPVRSLQRGAYSKGQQLLTNRVIKVSGSLAELPEGNSQQLAQLRAEDVPIASNGSVDFKRTRPVNLGSFRSTKSAA